MATDHLIVARALFFWALKVCWFDHWLEPFIVGVAVELPNVAITPGTSTWMEVVCVVGNSRLRDTLFDNVDPEFFGLENSADFLEVFWPSHIFIFDKPLLETATVHAIWLHSNQASLSNNILKLHLVRFREFSWSTSALPGRFWLLSWLAASLTLWAWSTLSKGRTYSTALRITNPLCSSNTWTRRFWRWPISGLAFRWAWLLGAGLSRGWSSIRTRRIGCTLTFASFAFWKSLLFLLDRCIDSLRRVIPDANREDVEAFHVNLFELVVSSLLEYLLTNFLIQIS